MHINQVATSTNTIIEKLTCYDCWLRLYCLFSFIDKNQRRIICQNTAKIISSGYFTVGGSGFAIRCVIFSCCKTKCFIPVWSNNELHRHTIKSVYLTFDFFSISLWHVSTPHLRTGRKWQCKLNSNWNVKMLSFYNTNASRYLCNEHLVIYLLLVLFIDNHLQLVGVCKVELKIHCVVFKCIFLSCGSRRR